MPETKVELISTNLKLRTPPLWLRPAPILVGLVLVGLAFLWSQSHPFAPMTVVDPGMTYHSGINPRDTTGRHSWTIRNRSRSPLTLRTHFTSGRCGFSLWLGQEKIVAPDESFVVWLTWTSPDQDFRSFSNQAEVWTNDPDRPKMVFKVVGKTRKTP